MIKDGCSNIDLFSQTGATSRGVASPKLGWMVRAASGTESGIKYLPNQTLCSHYYTAVGCEVFHQVQGELPVVLYWIMAKRTVFPFCHNPVRKDCDSQATGEKQVEVGVFMVMKDGARATQYGSHIVPRILIFCPRLVDPSGFLWSLDNYL